MQLSRRGFLGGLLAVVSAPAIVRVENLMVLPKPVKLLLPQEVFFEQAPFVWQGKNSLLTIDMITCEAIKLWSNSNVFIKAIDEQYDREFAVNHARIGDTLQIKLPNDYATGEGHQFA